MPRHDIDKILCIDDEENILNVFHRSLGRQYQIFTANGREQALEIIHTHGPFAVVISDYNMPGTNGIELLQELRSLTPDTIQIMLTGNIALDIAIKAINETDIFRYLPKPCPMSLLSKVIEDALGQYHLFMDKQRLSCELEQKIQELAATNEALAQQKDLLEQELEMARIVYGKIAAYQKQDLAGLDFAIIPKETVGGDFLLTHINAQAQCFYLMLGDLTGHGLQSALAALLVTDAFDELCTHSLSVAQFATNINEKMCRKLPTGLFCAACLVKVDLQSGLLEIWNGGLPDGYLLDEHGHIIDRVPSSNIPLGIVTAASYRDQVYCRPLTDIFALFVHSDGVNEQCNQEHTMFGEHALQAALLSANPAQQRIACVLNQLRAHQQSSPQGDDISLFELNIPKITTLLAQIGS